MMKCVKMHLTLLISSVIGEVKCKNLKYEVYFNKVGKYYSSFLSFKYSLLLLRRQHASIKQHVLWNRNQLTSLRLISLICKMWKKNYQSLPYLFMTKLSKLVM